MRKIIACLVILITLLFPGTPVSAAPSYKIYLDDAQDLLTDYEEQKLLLQMDRILHTAMPASSPSARAVTPRSMPRTGTKNCSARRAASSLSSTWASGTSGSTATAVSTRS